MSRASEMTEELNHAADGISGPPSGHLDDLLAHFLLMGHSAYESPFDCAKGLLARLNHEGYEIRRKPVTPRYSGHKSEKFFARIDQLDEPHREFAQLVARHLQNTELYMLSLIEKENSGIASLDDSEPDKKKK